MADEEIEGFGFEDEGGMGFGDEDFGGDASNEVTTAPPAQPEQPPQVQQQAPAPVAPPSKDEDSSPAVEDQAAPTDVVANLGHEQDVRLDKAGWLRLVEPRKTLSRRGGPKERWFKLDQGRLSYGASVTATPISTYEVSSITSIVENRDQPEAFTIVTEKKSLNVIAREEGDARAWIASLRKAQKTTRGTGATTGSALLF